jgi:hypothetical protein
LSGKSIVTDLAPAEVLLALLLLLAELVEELEVAKRVKSKTERGGSVDTNSSAP